MEVVQVPGCVADKEPAITCIVRIDWGLGKVGYAPVPLQRQGTQWEAPLLSTLLRDPVGPRVPAPTAAQAQAAARQFAQAQLAQGTTDDELELMASHLEVTAVGDDCKVDRDDGSVACHTEFRVPVAKDTPEQRLFDKRAHFYLEGYDWRFGRPLPAE